MKSDLVRHYYLSIASLVKRCGSYIPVIVLNLFYIVNILCQSVPLDCYYLYRLLIITLFPGSNLDSWSS